MSRPARTLWCGPLETLSDDVREAFDAPHFQKMFPEVGSRGLQRMLVVQAVLHAPTTGEEPKVGFLINDWIEVQEGNYRYLAIDDIGGLVIRIVVREYLACEVAWRLDRAATTQA